MKKIFRLSIIAFIIVIYSRCVFSQSALFIPDTLSGTVFNLNIQSGTSTFYAGHTTPTYGYNGNFLGPTLFMNKGDSITIHVTNHLSVATTVHWHGFHVPAKYDGGPHQIISPGATWSPSFVIRNNASTFWYHPHPHGRTEEQVTKGLAGMIIVRDSAEATYKLPRRYGMDDFPLIVQSRGMDVLYQFTTGLHKDTVLMVNGTLHPYLKVPRQVVRFRLLNGSADRTFNFGLSDSSNIYLFASDGGLLSAPDTTKRVRLSPGERAEVLINFSSDTIGQIKYLMSYASELPRGIIGADSVGTSKIVIGDGYYTNPLNGADFNIIRFDVIDTTASPVTAIPTAFSPIIPIPTASATVTRKFIFSPDTAFNGSSAYVDGPFFINRSLFSMDSINQIIYLNNIEIWTIINQTMVAHPFHVHDIQFFIVDINGNPPPPPYKGYKDVMLVMPADTVRFITKFSDFADDSIPYMYHCHLLHHEDDGMMGAFLVIDTTLSGISEKHLENSIQIFPNPSSGKFKIMSAQNEIKSISVLNMFGENIYQTSTGNVIQPQIIDLSSKSKGIYLIQIRTNQGIISKKIIVY